MRPTTIPSPAKTLDSVTAFADRDRWYPIFEYQGFIYPEAGTALVSASYETWLAQFADLDEDGYSEDLADIVIRVVAGEALPILRDGIWEAGEAAGRPEVALSLGEHLDEFELDIEVLEAWLDAVAVADSRNRRGSNPVSGPVAEGLS